MLINQIISQPLRIIVSIILTRILIPEDFGVVAKSFAITGIAEIVLVNSLLGAIIQDKNINKGQLDSLFILTVLWSFVITLIVFFSADLFSVFYSDSRVGTIVKLTSIAIFFSGFKLVPSALINKKLEFNKVFYASLSAILVSSIIAIYLAYNQFGYITLIVQYLLYVIVNSLVLFLMSSWKPSVYFKYNEIYSHLRFGYNVLGNSFLNYMVRSTDNIALGKFQSDESLGIYSRAYYLMMAPLEQVNKIFNNLLFPSFSMIQNNRKQIGEILLKTQELTLILFYPILTLIFFNIDFLIINILGDNWVQSIKLFKLFTPLIFIQLFTSLISNVFTSLNKVNYLFKFSLLTKPILIIAIIIAAWHGESEVAFIITLLSGIFSSVIYYKGLKLLNFEFIKDVLHFLLYFVYGWVSMIIVELILIYFNLNQYEYFISSLIVLLILYIYLYKVKSKIFKDIKEILYAKNI